MLLFLYLLLGDYWYVREVGTCGRVRVGGLRCGEYAHTEEVVEDDEQWRMHTIVRGGERCSCEVQQTRVEQDNRQLLLIFS